MSEAVGARGPEFHIGMDYRSIGLMFLLKNQRNTTKDPLLFLFLDHLLTQLQEQFSSDHQRVALGLSLVPSVMKDTSQWSEHVMEFGKTLPQ